MVDLHSWKNPCLFKHPVDLLFIAPHYIPVIIIGLFPLPAIEALQYTISEISFKLDIGSL
jgi:hypothetical protein